MTGNIDRHREDAVTDHPYWCDVDEHLSYVDESVGLDGVTAAELSVHRSHLHEHFMVAIRNEATGLLERRGGARWSAHVQQDPTIPGGYGGPPTIQFTVSTIRRAEWVKLPLTSGEARILAAQLEHLADLIDLR
jgi:hypothetical protein